MYRDKFRKVQRITVRRERGGKGWKVINTENGEQLDGGIVTRTRIPAGRRESAGSLSLSQWGSVNTTNRCFLTRLDSTPRVIAVAFIQTA